MIETEIEIHQPPQIDDMPDLSSIDNKLRLNLILSALSFRAGSSNVKARALWTNYIKLVDQLIREYNAAHMSLKEVVEDPGNIIGPLFRASTHMETCLKSLGRAIRYARRLRMKRDCPTCTELSVISETVIFRLNRMMQSVEALEERILSRSVEENEEIMLTLTDEGVEVGGEKIFYSDLAVWIEELYTLAIEMTNY